MTAFGSWFRIWAPKPLGGWLWALIVMAAASGAGRASEADRAEEAQATVIICNSAIPGSLELGQYYAQQRKIPEGNIVELTCSKTEEITRQEFDQAIAAPLKETFVRRGWWRIDGGRVTVTRIRFVAMMQGMPLKVAPDPTVAARADQPAAIGARNEASVDSEVACMGLGQIPLPGLIPNPFFRRFTPIMESITDPGLLLVCRLAAPSDADVRRMIDDSVATEQGGLWGWAYVDSRSIKDPGYIEGDEWLSAAAGEMRKSGIPVLWDKAPETLPAGYPMTDAAVYLGWYAEAICGPMADPSFRFRRGAIAVHIHSFSASTLADAARGWCGPLIAHGAAATLGNVYEPYLTLTAHLDVFQDRLLQGFNFAESAYAALRGLSWMNVSIGDPLYRPYGNWNKFDAAGGEGLTNWRRYRNIILDKDGDVLAAAGPLTDVAKRSGDPMFLESLAAAQADSGDATAALRTINHALAMKAAPEVKFRLTLEKIGLVRASGDLGEAGRLTLGAQSLADGPSETALLRAIYLRMFPPTPTPSQQATR